MVYRSPTQDPDDTARARAEADAFAALSPVERLAIANRASIALHQLSIAGLRAQYPSADDEELFRRAGARRLGREATLRFFGARAEAWLD